MSWELILWLLSFAFTIALIAANLYQIICLSDLEFDYINPYDSSSRINGIVVKEFLVQGALCVLYLLTWHWFMFLISAPVTYYHLKLYMERKHLVDVTEIFSLLNGEKKYRYVKLGFYLFLFCVVIFRLVRVAVLAVLAEDDDFLDSGIF
ncbi:Cornichon [Macleaya cordata]|uniref:Cornichon n=1 Tax=Macleaya cordata TaxID=56857 RepID=A0A200QBJ2_MACCD|nr:Cornichon [Macleaya cordata]